MTVMHRSILITLLCLPGCSEPSAEKSQPVSAEDVRRELGEAMDAVVQFTLQQRDELVEQMNLQLKDFDDEIAQLEAEARTRADEARDTLEQRLSELREQRETFRQKIDELATSSEETWESVKSEASHALDELRESIHRATAADPQSDQ